MATITQIEIDGFKAFPTNFTLSLGTGQNLLLYGENGSGKSSLYYAIHALMQSVLKDDKGAKYFKPGDVNGADFIANNEHLINILDLMKLRPILTRRIYVLLLTIIRFGGWIIVDYHQKMEEMRVKLEC